MIGQDTRETAPRFTIGRMTDNELIFFDEQAKESWIIYPPRSAYSHVKRPTRDTTVVEHHPWAPYSIIVQHAVRPAVGCGEHGIACGASEAVKRAAQVGWNAFE